MSYVTGMLLDLLFVCSRNKRKLKHDDLDNNTVCFLCLDRSISVHGSQRGESVWPQNDSIFFYHQDRQNKRVACRFI